MGQAFRKPAGNAKPHKLFALRARLMQRDGDSRDDQELPSPQTFIVEEAVRMTL
jgi:hypothetical protein